MGWIERLSGRDRVEATSAELGVVLFRASLNAGRELARGLCEAGGPTDLAEQPETVGEMLAFLMFAFHLVVKREFGLHAPSILSAYRQFAFEQLRETGYPAFQDAGFINGRIADYAQAWAADPDGAGLMRVARLGATNILKREPDALVLPTCLIHFTAITKSFAGIGGKYRVV